MPCSLSGAAFDRFMVRDYEFQPDHARASAQEKAELQSDIDRKYVSTVANYHHYPAFFYLWFLVAVSSLFRLWFHEEAPLSGPLGMGLGPCPTMVCSCPHLNRACF